MKSSALTSCAPSLLEPGHPRSAPDMTAWCCGRHFPLTQLPVFTTWDCGQGLDFGAIIFWRDSELCHWICQHQPDRSTPPVRPLGFPRILCLDYLNYLLQPIGQIPYFFSFESRQGWLLIGVYPPVRMLHPMLGPGETPAHVRLYSG